MNQIDFFKVVNKTPTFYPVFRLTQKRGEWEDNRVGDHYVYYPRQDVWRKIDADGNVQRLSVRMSPSYMRFIEYKEFKTEFQARTEV